MLDATPLLKLYARRRIAALAAQHAPAAQERQLLGLVRTAAATRFGRDHRFAEIRSVADFQARVPLRRYEDFWSQYWREAFPTLRDCTWPGTIPFFAATSGTTTGATKYIPCSHAMNRSNNRAAIDLLVHHVTNRPDSRVLAGKNLVLGGSAALVEEAPGIYSGDLSGIVAHEVPWWARARYFPPRALALIGDWEEKIRTLAPLSLSAGIRSISGTPSWLLLLFDKLAELRPQARGLADFYPALEMLVHGGVNFAPYRRRIQGLLAGSRAETREVYPASEGFVAVADRGDGDGLRLIVDNGLFFEFVPVDELAQAAPTRHTVADIALGIDYAVVLSSCAGVWGYILGDTVKFVDRNPPRLVVSGRTSYFLSAFGEHLIDQEIEDAVAAAAAAIGATVTDYSVWPVFPQAPGERGGHLYVVEFGERDVSAARIEGFASALDAELCAANLDYNAHRSGGFGLDRPRIRPVSPGTFAGWMKSRGKLGGQHKVPRIINDQRLAQDLLDYVTRHP
jgi:hypothetical protein